MYLRQVGIVVLLFVVGLACGSLTSVDPAALDVSIEALLFILILLIGVVVGVDYERFMRISAHLKPSTILVISTVSGSILGGAMLALVSGLPLGASLTIAAGMGWYSFTGSYLTIYNPYYGLLGFSSNLLREIITIVSYPILASRLRVEAISIGGATTMDTSLPVIARFGGSEAAVIALIHGLILTVAIPFILPLLWGI